MATDRDDAITQHWQRFGAWLEEQRLIARLSATEAARRAGIHLTSWSRIENGGAGTKRTTMPRILAAVGIGQMDPRYAEGYQIAGFVPPAGVDGATVSADFGDAPAAETREIHEDLLEEFDRTYFRFEGDAWFQALPPHKRMEAVRKIVEDRRREEQKNPGG